MQSPLGYRSWQSPGIKRRTRSPQSFQTTCQSQPKEKCCDFWLLSTIPLA
jgi:hypothetical protein